MVRVGTLLVRRPSDMGGRLRHLQVIVDGTKVASLKVNEQAIVELDAGSHVLVGKMDWARSKDLIVQIPDSGQVAVEVSLPFASVILSFIRPKQAVLTRFIQ